MKGQLDSWRGLVDLCDGLSRGNRIASCKMDLGWIVPRKVIDRLPTQTRGAYVIDMLAFGREYDMHMIKGLTACLR